MFISPSSISNFLRCRQLYHYANRLKLEPHAVKPAFFLGSGVHDALQHWYQGDTADPVDWFRGWAATQIVVMEQGPAPIDRTQYFDLVDLGCAMLEGYVERYDIGKDYDRDGIRLRAKELPFEVPIPGTDGALVGRVDGICLDGNQGVWVFETKTFSQAPKRHDMNLQTLAYTWAFNQPAGQKLLESLGVPAGTRVHGSLYNGLRKQLPSDRVRTPLFVREWVYRTDAELNRFEQMLVLVHQEMSRHELGIFPTLTRECEWCSYVDPCTANLTGADEQWILKTLYTRKPPRVEERT